MTNAPMHALCVGAFVVHWASQPGGSRRHRYPSARRAPPPIPASANHPDRAPGRLLEPRVRTTYPCSTGPPRPRARQRRTVRPRAAESGLRRKCASSSPRHAASPSLSARPERGRDPGPERGPERAVDPADDHRGIGRGGDPWTPELRAPAGRPRAATARGDASSAADQPTAQPSVKPMRDRGCPARASGAPSSTSSMERSMARRALASSSPSPRSGNRGGSPCSGAAPPPAAPRSTSIRNSCSVTRIFSQDDHHVGAGAGRRREQQRQHRARARRRCHRRRRLRPARLAAAKIEPLLPGERRPAWSRRSSLSPPPTRRPAAAPPGSNPRWRRGRPPSVAQASGRRCGESARKATSVSTCATVTALPPARAGMARGRCETKVATNATVATMSRSSTPTISYGSSRPLNATTPNAEAMNSLSATGSITVPKRRAAEPARELAVEQVGGRGRGQHDEPPRRWRRAETRSRAGSAPRSADRRWSSARDLARPSGAD